MLRHKKGSVVKASRLSNGNSKEAFEHRDRRKRAAGVIPLQVFPCYVGWYRQFALEINRSSTMTGEKGVAGWESIFIKALAYLDVTSGKGLAHKMKLDWSIPQVLFSDAAKHLVWKINKEKVDKIKCSKTRGYFKISYYYDCPSCSSNPIRCSIHYIEMLRKQYSD